MFSPSLSPPPPSLDNLHSLLTVVHKLPEILDDAGATEILAHLKDFQNSQKPPEIPLPVPENIPPQTFTSSSVSSDVEGSTVWLARFRSLKRAVEEKAALANEEIKKLKQKEKNFKQKIEELNEKLEDQRVRANEAARESSDLRNRISSPSPALVDFQRRAENAEFQLSALQKKIKQEENQKKLLEDQLKDALSESLKVSEESQSTLSEGLVDYRARYEDLVKKLRAAASHDGQLRLLGLLFESDRLEFRKIIRSLEREICQWKNQLGQANKRAEDAEGELKASRAIHLEKLRKLGEANNNELQRLEKIFSERLAIFYQEAQQAMGPLRRRIQELEAHQTDDSPQASASEDSIALARLRSRLTSVELDYDRKCSEFSSIEVELKIRRTESQQISALKLQIERVQMEQNLEQRKNRGIRLSGFCAEALGSVILFCLVILLFALRAPHDGTPEFG